MARSSQRSPSLSEASRSAGKRRQTDELDTSRKKSRTRVSFSCGECHRRKQKCDRQTPCSHCIARKVPELCRQYSPGRSEQDVHMRLRRLEQIVETALPHLAFSNDQHESRSVTPEDDDQSPAEEDSGNGTIQDGRWYGNSAAGPFASASVIAQLQYIGTKLEAKQRGKDMPSLADRPPPHDRPSRGDRHGQDTTSAILASVRQGIEPSTAEKLKTLFQECGVSPNTVTELLQELPTRRFSDVLIDHFFSQINWTNWTRFAISEEDFRGAYTALSNDSLSANPNDIRFLPLLYIVLSISVRLAPDHIAGDDRTRRLTSLRYCWASRRSMLIAGAIQPDSLDMVLTRLLTARFLTFDRRIAESWSQLGAAVRTAQALGLHRDGTTMGLDAVQVEYRRRIWAVLYHADRSYALFLGRPHTIQDDHCSTLPPANIEDLSTLSNSHHPWTGAPISQPTRMTLVILRQSLAGIIGRIIHHFQRVKTSSHYHDVLALDDELQSFADALPPYFATEPDESLDVAFKFIPEHRYQLIAEILFVRMSLHRPYILRRLGSDRFERSRTTCFECGMKDYQVRRAFMSTNGHTERTRFVNAFRFKNTYREFQTAMIAGIYLILHPNGKDASAMHTILDSFLEGYSDIPDLDATTRREKKIIEFFKSKSRPTGADFARPTNSAVQIDPALTHMGGPMEAQLLLELQKSDGRPPVAGPSRSAIPADSAAVSNDQTSTSTSIANGFSSPTGLPQSGDRTPAVHQRIQQLGIAEERNQSPSTTEGSAGDESAAQNLLDYWYHNVSNAPPMEEIEGMQWGNGTGGGEFSNWLIGGTPLLSGGQLGPLNGQDGSDWNYWEMLVNQIRSEPLP